MRLRGGGRPERKKAQKRRHAMFKRFSLAVIFLFTGCATMAQVTPGPIRELDFTVGPFAVQMYSFEDGEESIVLQREGQTLSVTVKTERFDCPDDVLPRKVHARGELMCSSFDNGKPVHFNLLINYQKDGSLVREFEPRKSISKFINFARNETPFLERMSPPNTDLVFYSWYFPLEFELLRETALTAAQRLACDVLFTFIEPNLASTALFSKIRTDCQFSLEVNPNADISFTCPDGKRISMGTGNNDGKCYKVGSYAVCSDAYSTGTTSSGAWGDCKDGCTETWGSGYCRED
jgi:hypothetical protein